MKIGRKIRLSSVALIAATGLALVAGCANSGNRSGWVVMPTPTTVAQTGAANQELTGSSAAPPTVPTAGVQAVIPTPSIATSGTPTVATTPQPPQAGATAPLAVNDVPLTTNVSRVSFAEEGADFDPCVSRDGTKVVFASTQHKNTSDIFIKRTDSRVVTQLTDDPAQDTMPALSPDGTKIAFASDRTGNWDIFVMPVNGGRAVQITSDSEDEIHPSWSPDGKQLVFCRLGQASGRWEMWVTDIQNPAAQNFIGYGMFPQWCPVAGTGENGCDRILFQLGKERGRRAFGIWTVDVGQGIATNATEIISSGATALINPAWSPDGKWIVYAEVPVSTGPDYAIATDQKDRMPIWSVLWMLSTEGEGRVRLTSGPGIALSPAWGVNNRLFFVSDRAGTENVWSLDITSAVQSAQATIGSGPAVANKTPSKAPTPAPAAGKTTVANVPEQGSNASPR
jgi:Tol biopolymer transport system component